MKTAIVTGASRGIGKAIAKRLAADGMRVVLVARDEALLNQTAREIGSAWASATQVVALDLRLPDAGQRVVDATLEAFGEIDALVNNAGATKRGEFLSLTEEDWMDGFALKMFGAVRLTRVAWSYLKQSSGSLINIAGSGGRTPGAEFTIGGSVNAALLSFTKAMADVGLSDGVQVNAVNPGPVRTERFERRLGNTPLDSFIRSEKITKVGDPDDIAALVAFILSPHGRLLHGSLIDIDGGLTKTM